jgi:diguanylate cyclase (GGDEF)-like protein
MQDKGRVLVVDSDPLNRVVLENTLSDECDLTLLESSEEAMSFLATHHVDLIITDIKQTDRQGTVLLQKLKDAPSTYMIPVIIISASNSYSDEAQGLQMGAVDYITKPYSPLIVRARVKIHLSLKKKRDLLEKLASIDGLTELPNRRLFDERLAKSCRTCHASGQSLTLMLIDIDFFKNYNDAYGYALGDECLIKVAHALARVVNEYNGFLARFDGVRFAVLVVGCTHEMVLELANALHDAVDQLLLPHQRSPICAHVSISIGVAFIASQAGTDVNACLQYVNDALSEAQKSQQRLVLKSR